MHTYSVRLCPAGGGITFTISVQANSDVEARRIANASYPGHDVRACNMVH